MLSMTFLMFIVQVKAQFGEPGDGVFAEDDGPPPFEEPPENDVPLDTYQWIMLALALAYGIYIFWKHHQKTKQTKQVKQPQTALSIN